MDTIVHGRVVWDVVVVGDWDLIVVIEGVVEVVGIEEWHRVELVVVVVLHGCVILGDDVIGGVVVELWVVIVDVVDEVLWDDLIDVVVVVNWLDTDHVLNIIGEIVKGDVVKVV